MDTSLLEPGITDYNLLKESYIILIMTSDLLGLKKYVYTFKAQCQEAQEYLLKDGATRIFLNTKGKNRDEVSEELVDFLRYVESSTDETVASIKSDRIHRIHQRVCKVRTNEQVGVRYMQAWEERIYEKEEAREEGMYIHAISLVKSNLSKGVSVSDIAKFMDESEDSIEKIAAVIKSHPEADDEELYSLIYPSEEN